ncbi:MAG TPA: UDP-N-acetylglucosamine 1-carboxyvinyltransferase [Verrucomicrobiota bacterium]|nr:UDP-N-acetylglucosamine 1-carboxyvinyltransferase [Verrucomicrobiota bacterium]
MDYLEIKGGNPLKGEVRISGSKNAVLPILAATLLTDEKCVIRGIPDLSDVKHMAKILQTLGAEVVLEAGTVTVQAKSINPFGDYDIIRKMRGSVCIMGPLLGRLHEAKVSMPGGCVIGARPINLHLWGFKSLGALIDLKEGYVIAKAPQLEGASIFMGGRNGSTVLGTANVMMAAVLAKGQTVIEYAACEPEIKDLADFLVKMGADIRGAGSPTIRIRGVEKLHGAEHTVIPDRIEAATYAIAAAATDGEVTLLNAEPDHIQAILHQLSQANVSCTVSGKEVTIKRKGELRPVSIATQPYPGYPTDAQAQLMALMTQARGISIITERIFESRFMHVPELGRLGAHIELEGVSAIVEGGFELQGAHVMSSDLRASAALVIAGLVAKSTTIISRIYHLDRGYEKMDVKLRNLGGDIGRWDSDPSKPNYRPVPPSLAQFVD